MDITMDPGRRVLKSPEIQESIHLEDPETARRRQEAEATDVVREARLKAERTLAEAFEAIRRERERGRLEAEETLADLERRKAEILAQLEEEAIRKAEERVEAEFRPRLEKQATEFERLVQRAEELLEEVLHHNRNDLVDLALGAAEKVVGKIASEDASLVERSVLKAIEAARDRQEMIVRVHPQDLEVLERLKVSFMDRFDDLRKIEVEVDGRVDRGGVWIETLTGFIDGRIRTQMDEILASVLPESENPRFERKKEPETSGNEEVSRESEEEK